ncbi:MAG: hypothetical protein HC881_22240 [Leptolyngbyaceae cyanobacterium SL_7_1]|nr:hypothetical protein [Leptolyngbyaceae cyanobacterium SL_7_1]
MQLPDLQTVIQAQQSILKHCAEMGNRLAILDALPTENLEVIKQQRNQLLINQREPINGTLYYPWLKNAQAQIVPPCGHVAGIFARSD